MAGKTSEELEEEFKQKVIEKLGKERYEKIQEFLTYTKELESYLPENKGLFMLTRWSKLAFEFKEEYIKIKKEVGE